MDLRSREKELDSEDASRVAEAFGATIAVAPLEQSLFFVAGRRRSPRLLIERSGGSVVCQLANQRKVLAIIPVSSHQALVRHPDIAVAGPVSVDQARFARFAALVGITTSSGESGEQQ